MLNFGDPLRLSLTRDDSTSGAAPPQFGPFRVLHQVGIGALGPVFRTYEPDRDRLVAVKVFRLDITPEQARSLADELSRAPAAGLFHPSIVEPIAAGIEGSVAYSAEEYVAAESLDAGMRGFAPAPAATVLPWITQLAGAIDFARAAGVGHGALHPRDIFITQDEARVTGFGVVEALERVGLRAPVRRPYSPPERVAGEPWGTPADVYSLAAVAYELLTGRRPAGAGPAIGPLSGGATASGEALRAVLAKAMDPDPAARHPSALAFASALEEASRVEEPLRIAPAAAPVPVPPDILTEREEDDAHHQLLLHELESDSRPEPAIGVVEPDRQREPEVVDQNVSDPLILRAAGAAAADTPLDDLQPPPAQDQVTRGPYGSRPSPAAERPKRAYSHAEPAGERRGVLLSPSLEPIGRHRRMWPIAIVLLLGLVGGLAGGYALWGPPRTEIAATGTTGADETGASDQGRDTPEEVGASGTASPAAPPAGPPPAVPGAAANPPLPPAAPVTGTLVVRSTPSRAGVTVNGRWRGRTPLTLEDLALSSYRVRIVQRGYASVSESVTLSEEDPSQTIAVRLQRTRAPDPAPSRSASAEPERYTGSIYVDSRPRGAQVSINGKPVGVTPLRVPEVPIGSHVVRMELPDHRIWSSATRVAAGQEARVTGSLERIQ